MSNIIDIRLARKMIRSGDRRSTIADRGMDRYAEELSKDVQKCQALGIVAIEDRGNSLHLVERGTLQATHPEVAHLMLKLSLSALLGLPNP